METISADLRHELVVQVEDEGNPVLFGPKDLPAGELPRHWRDVLSSERPGAVAADLLWAPLEPILPRTVDAIRYRLQAVLFLHTRLAPASLLYFFRDEEDYFVHRGLPPLQCEPKHRLQIPKECYEFYAVHNGWPNFYSEEDGLIPHERLYPLTNWLGDRGLQLPPNRLDPDRVLVGFESSPAYVLGFDTAHDGLCVRVWDDCSAEVVPDFISELDEEYGEFLEQLERAK